MLRPSLFSIAVLLSLSACDKGGADNASAKAAASAPPTLQLQAEDVFLVKSGALSYGPVVTGVVQPERRADLRAELATVVVQVFKENGDSVKRGELLLRLDDAAIRDTLTSAEEAVRAASQSLVQAERVLERQKTLRASGMTSSQALEDTELRRNNAQNDLIAARARAASARQQLTRTEVRAPFDGVVSERRVSVGDTVQIGRELVKVIDPTSMRFEGFVTADRVNELKLGQTASFKVNGYGQQEFVGHIKRIDPTANNLTRQVAVQIAFADQRQPKVAGLFAEGRIETGSVASVMVPEAVLVRAGDKVSAWRLSGGRLNKVTLTLGERDQRRGDYVVKGGVAVGEQLIRNPSSSLRDGQLAQLGSAAKTATVAPTSSGGAATSAAR